MNEEERLQLAALVRDECVRAFMAAAEDAGLQGLCTSGQLDVAIDTLRQLDPQQLLDAAMKRRGHGS